MNSRERKYKQWLARNKKFNDNVESEMKRGKSFLKALYSAILKSEKKDVKKGRKRIIS